MLLLLYSAMLLLYCCCYVVLCCRVTDVSIASTVLDFAYAVMNGCLTAVDTDPFMMFLYLYSTMMRHIAMKSESTWINKESVPDVGKIAECFGEVCKYIKFIHVFGGCYTTSAIFGQGKLSILKLIGKSIRSGDAANIFLEKWFHTWSN